MDDYDPSEIMTADQFDDAVNVVIAALNSHPDRHSPALMPARLALCDLVRHDKQQRITLKMLKA